MKMAAMGRIVAAFAVHGYLSDIVRAKFAADLSKGPLRLCFFPDQNIRHCAETLGIPRFEIGRVLVDGKMVGLEERLFDGASVDLFPADEPVKVGEPRFAVDVHLGRLAKNLRILGFDVLWKNDISDGELAAEGRLGRIVLTRDRGVLFRREILLGMFVRSTDPYEQLLLVMRRLGLAGGMNPFSRCIRCGGNAVPASKSEVRSSLPDLVAQRYDEFYQCTRCGRVYWRGDHFRNIVPFLERLGRDLRCNSCGPPAYMQ